MRRRAAIVPAVVLVACGGTSTRCPETAPSAHHAEHAHHDFSDVARFEAMFDAPDRDGWQRPAEVMALLDAQPGQTAADVGTGTGYFLPFLSVAVGPRGRVLALDVEPAMIAHVRERASREGLANVDARVVDGADPALDPASVDRILVVDTWHHLADPPEYARRLAAALRPGGSVLIVDFTRETERGPPVAERVAPEAVAAALAGAGLDASVVAEGLPDQYVVRGAKR